MGIARYSINPDTGVYRESEAKTNEMHRLSRKPPSDVVLIENFPLIFNDPASENETVHAAHRGIRPGARIR